MARAAAGGEEGKCELICGDQAVFLDGWYQDIPRNSKARPNFIRLASYSRVKAKSL